MSCEERRARRSARIAPAPIVHAALCALTLAACAQGTADDSLDDDAIGNVADAPAEDTSKGPSNCGAAPPWGRCPPGYVQPQGESSPKGDDDDASPPEKPAADSGTVDAHVPTKPDVDSGVLDTGTHWGWDSGTKLDTGKADTGKADTGKIDTGTIDTGTIDSGSIDLGIDTAPETSADTAPEVTPDAAPDVLDDADPLDGTEVSDGI